MKIYEITTKIYEITTRWVNGKTNEEVPNYASYFIKAKCLTEAFETLNLDESEIVDEAKVVVERIDQVR